MKVREQFFTKEQLLCCLITGPIIAELKCTSHTYCKVAALRCSDSVSHRCKLVIKSSPRGQK